MLVPEGLRDFQGRSINIHGVLRDPMLIQKGFQGSHGHSRGFQMRSRSVSEGFRGIGSIPGLFKEFQVRYTRTQWALVVQVFHGASGGSRVVSEVFKECQKRSRIFQEVSWDSIRFRKV